MIPAIAPVSSLLATAVTPGAGTASSGASADFSNVLGSALDALDQTTSSADTLSLQGATGQANVADVTVAATEAQLAVQLATTLRNEGVSALNAIMSMSAG